MSNRIALPSLSTFIIVLTPMILLLLPLYNPGKESVCAFVILLTAVYWVSVCLPVAVTATIPVFLFSVSGILTMNEMTQSFFFSGLWLLIGVYMITIAAQKASLHEKMALKILIVMGADPKRMLFGFMTTSFLLSAFIPNTSVTAMLMPIGENVIQSLKQYLLEHDEADENKKMIMNEKERNRQENMLPFNELEKFDEHEKLKLMTSRKKSRAKLKSKTLELENLSKAVALVIPFGSTIGGVCTLVGSIPNILAVALIHSLFPKSEIITFGTWALYCTPGAFVIYISSFIWIMWRFIGIKESPHKKTDAEKKQILNIFLRRYNLLGPIRWDQGWIIATLIFVAILWFTRNPGFVSGWGSLFPKINDGTISLGGGLLMTLLPKHKPKFRKVVGSTSCIPDRHRKILTFIEFKDHFCWEIIFIAGGGMVLAKGAQVSGLTDVIALSLSQIGHLPSWLVCFSLSAITSILTECTTNMAVMSLMIPLLSKLAVTLRIHPYYICLTSVLCSTLAFMLPVATPPNAIAYSTGMVTVKDMIKTGWMMNLIGIFVINLSINTYGRVYFGLDHFPDWAGGISNSTMTSNYTRI